MKVKILIASAIALVFLSGPSRAVYRAYWFEPSKDLLAAEEAGDLVKGETRILDSMATPEGVTFQLVTYRTTRHRCFDVTAHTEAGPRGAGGGCGFGSSGLGERELKVSIQGSLNFEEGHFSTVIGRAGSQVRKIRVLYGDERTDIRSVHTDLRVWFAVSSPGRNVVSWEPAD